MRYQVEIGNRLRNVTVIRTSEGLAVEIDGHTWYVDAARIDAHRMSLLVGEVAPARQTGPGPGTVSWEVAFSSGSASGPLVVHVGATPFAVTVNGRRRRQPMTGSGAQGGTPGSDRPERVQAPMPGKVVRVRVRVGDLVRAHQPLVVVEAMKMENELRAGRDGRVAAIHVQEGVSVDAGALMVVIE
jgi:biotin carboxyl carrier protein